MADYHSGSTLRQHRLRNLLLSSNLMLLLYLLISLIMLALLNISAFGLILTGKPFGSEDITPLTDGLSQFQDRLSTPIVMVFWLFIGAATYTAIWLSENVFFIARSEVEESHYLSAGSSLRGRYLKTTLASNLLLVLVVLLWVSAIALYIRWLLPVYSNLFHSALISLSVSERLINIVVAVVGNALVIYLLLLMRRIINALWTANRP